MPGHSHTRDMPKLSYSFDSSEALGRSHSSVLPAHACAWNLFASAPSGKIGSLVSPDQYRPIFVQGRDRHSSARAAALSAYTANSRATVLSSLAGQAGSITPQVLARQSFVLAEATWPPPAQAVQETPSPTTARPTAVQPPSRRSAPPASLQTQMIARSIHSASQPALVTTGGQTNLQRLFYTAAQRQRIDYIRGGGADTPPPAPPAEPVAIPRVTPRKPVRSHGVISRQGRVIHSWK